MAEDSQIPGKLQLPLTAVAVTATTTAIAALTTLLIVATVTDANAQATVALLLAIIAFVAQILMFIAQASGLQDQNLRTERIYGETLGLLGQLREKAEGTQQVVDRQYDRLIDLLAGSLNKTLNEQRLSVATPQGARQVAERAVEAIRDEIEGPDAGPRTWPRRRPQSSDNTIVSHLSSYPSREEAPDVLTTLRELPDEARLFLWRLGRDDASSRTSTLEPGLFQPEDDPETQALVVAGLARKREPELRDEQLGWPMYVLTNAGRAAVRPYTAVGPLPEYLQEAEELLPEAVRTAWVFGDLEKVADHFAARSSATPAPGGTAPQA